MKRLATIAWLTIAVLACHAKFRGRRSPSSHTPRDASSRHQDEAQGVAIVERPYRANLKEDSHLEQVASRVSAAQALSDYGMLPQALTEGPGDELKTSAVLGASAGSIELSRLFRKLWSAMTEE